MPNTTDTRIITYGDLSVYSNKFKETRTTAAEADTRYLLKSAVGTISEDEIAALFIEDALTIEQVEDLTVAALERTTIDNLHP